MVLVRKPFKMFEVDYHMVTFSRLCVYYVYYPCIKDED